MAVGDAFKKRRNLVQPVPQRPYSFNPQNQDVLARASAALDAIKKDRLNPMYGGAQGYAAPGQNSGIMGSPGLRTFVDSVGQGLRSMYESVTTPVERYTRPVPNLIDAMGSVPSNPVRSEYAPNNAGPVPRSVTSQSPSYYQQQAAGMDVESIRMRGLAGQIDALRQRSQHENPVVPTNPVNPMQAEIDRGTRQGEIMFTPGATSSYGATKNFRNMAPEGVNSVTAGTVNGYNGNVGYATNPMRMTPERKETSARNNALRIAGGGVAADPTNIGGRFGGAYGAGLEADAAAIRDGRAVRTADGKVVYFTGTQESARAAQNAGKADREWLRNRNNMNVPQAELDRRAAADARKAERAAKHQAFKDANGGMSYRQYDRMTGSSSGNNALTMKAVREGRLSPEEANYRMQLRAEKALRRSGNPITGGTSQAGRFFPDQMAGKGGQAQAPVALANPIFGPGSGNTADARQARQKVRQGLFAGVPASGDTPASPPHPVFSDLGITGDTSVPQFQGVMNSAADTGAEFTPDGIRQLLIFSQTFDPNKGAKTPFQNTGDPMASALDELYGMPESATDQQLMDWWNRYVAKRKETYQAGSYGTTFESGF